MKKSNIIQELGGAKAVGDAMRARSLKVEDVTVRSWTLQGRTIPAKYWVHIAAIAEAKGKTVSFEKLAQQAAA